MDNATTNETMTITTVRLWIGQCYDGSVTPARALELVADSDGTETVTVETQDGETLAIEADLDMECLVLRHGDEIVHIGETVDTDTLDRWV